MDWKRLAQKAVRTGVRQGIGYMRRSGKDTTALRVVDSLLSEDRRTAPPHSPGRRTPDAAPSTRRDRGAERKDLPGTTEEAADDTRAEFDRSRSATRPKPAQRFPKRPDGGYPGDYRGPIKPVYAPDLDGKADPGEIVWAWVPYEEDHTRGKDRPVLVIGRDGRWLLALMLTSKDNIPGGVGDVHTDEHGTPYINIGSGGWDAQGRPSEVRLDRIIRVEQSAVRREGAVMPMDRFSSVVDAIDAH
ncbi:type II toxin-antitoxin system PemK/MazF family toxin [Brevibacterium yomogidense]|uniref:type II toxin-antitoxin system PemK/MazF family toxin n=1 Tax=Brevibacterium yomogidense TaxID=946573 RepID=UPI0018DFB7C4|nr:type II toxin-antitoxin system PemK/MazF family toxin [Brevibacterium yomogidense]